MAETGNGSSFILATASASYDSYFPSELVFHDAVHGPRNEPSERPESLIDEYAPSATSITPLHPLFSGCGSIDRAMSSYSKSITSKDISYAVRGLKGMSLEFSYNIRQPISSRKDAAPRSSHSAHQAGNHI
jgi:hypothetical protein